jgi:very-short-patch-repair endonuclease
VSASRASLTFLPRIEGEAVPPDERIAAIACRQFGAFTINQARAAGFTRSAIQHRLKVGRWLRLHPGVYAIAGSPSTHEQRVLAAVMACGRGAVAASRTAAWLDGLIAQQGDLVYVLVAKGQHQRARKGIVVNEASLTKSDVRTVAGIPRTAPERTVVDAAGVLRKPALESLLDDAVQSGLTTIPKLRRYIRERRLGHRPGARVLRELLEDRTSRGVPHKDLEKLFLRKLHGTDLPQPVRQHPCGEFFIDAAYPNAKLAIELDGLRDHFSADAFRRDRRRQNEIVLAGYTVLRFTWQDVDERWSAVEATIRRALPN